jgi:acyl-homoserine-lactone acylase
MNMKVCTILITLLSLTACQEDKWKTNDEPTPNDPPIPSLVAFDPDGKLEADIRWTTYGVPHITADNLQSLAYGNAYAYARDNYCTLAEQIVKIRSERSKYFGPDLEPDSGDSANIVSDFGFKSLKLLESATQKYTTFSDNSRALLEGYSQGFNQYLDDTGAENLAPQCASADWVQHITPQELAAYYVSINMLKSSAQQELMELAFYANAGDGTEFLPYSPTMPSPAEFSNSPKLAAPSVHFDTDSLRLPKSGGSEMGSNGWALGSEMTENGKGALLGNPHFPIAGNLRFWQSHLTIPGVMNVAGGALQGFPFVQMGFNDNIAWTHTVSNSEHFVLYQLALGDDRLTYLLDDEERSIEKQTFAIDVNIGNGEFVSMSKDYYYSHHGLMVEMPAESMVLGWDDSQAFTLRDATAESWDSIDHWLQINLAGNLQEFQQTFKDYDGTAFVNTLYSDDQGNSFYINNSRVFGFSESAKELLKNDPIISATHDMFELYILPGDTSVFEPESLSSFQDSPQLLRSDFVQNSNDSYWATNPEEPLSGYSALYGSEFSPLSLRTRMSLKMLRDSAGGNNKFNINEMESALLSNRAYLAEMVLPDLLAQCTVQANEEVTISTGQSVDISQACVALHNWDGTMNTDSVAAHLFREFAFKFNMFTQLSVAYDPNDPANTPNTLSPDLSVMQSFATAVANLDQAGFAYDETLGNMQFFEKTMADGTGSGEKMPWGGPNEVEGGFNIQSVWLLADTRLPVHQYMPAFDVEYAGPMASGLSEQGYSVTFSSSWVFAVNFTDNGPVARGILMNSQSSDSRSAHFDDQSRHYSTTNSLRPIIYSEADISQNLIESFVVKSE